MSKKKKLIIVGAHGSGEIAMSTFEACNSVKDEWDIQGYLNDVKAPGEFLGKYKVLGASAEVMDWVSKGYYVHYTLHFNAKEKEERVKKLKSLKIPLDALASAVHPLAYINPESKIGENTLFLPYTATSVGTKIGNYSHVYTAGFLGHNCQLNDFSTIAAHSVIGGRSIISEGVHIGLNSTIREDITIGKYSIIGMGAVVTKNIAARTTNVGNPAIQI